MKILPTIMLIYFLAGCATTPTIPPTMPIATKTGMIHHTVRSGQTLWTISKIYGVDLNSLIMANDIRDSALLEKGHVLVIPGAYRRKETPSYYAVSNESFAWPIRGYLLAPFGSKVNNVINKGIDIKASEGSSVKAARSGKVVYCDSHLKGFGKTVIIDHGEGLQSVYSYNSDIMVSVGLKVAKSETIAKVGMTGRAKEPSLHFEVRKDGEPQNPLYYLPR
ncbi:MAG: LysM peptidoglycan-binding domain-containing M23 family metallopeptidase [Candidatus Omnitrophota bacterium]|nr:LysM peptidoglycan-binding domain-containing M23 family metallopeptidase [Candidatus Omnitrophota bacterium]